MISVFLLFKPHSKLYQLPGMMVPYAIKVTMIKQSGTNVTIHIIINIIFSSLRLWVQEGTLSNVFFIAASLKGLTKKKKKKREKTQSNYILHKVIAPKGQKNLGETTWKYIWLPKLYTFSTHMILILYLINIIEGWSVYTPSLWSQLSVYSIFTCNHVICETPYTTCLK